MNKNIVKLFAIVMMIFMIGAVLVACGAQGEQGEQGIQGEAGVPGEQGPQGVPGETPYIGENGNWWVGDEDTGVKAAGTDADSIRCEEHHWDTEYIVIKEHTMDSIGVILKACVDCDGAEFVRIDHEFVAGEPVAPTCQAEGYTPYTCSCGLVEKRDIVPVIDCILGEKEYVKNEAGICECEWTNPYVQHCTMCGEILVSSEDGKKDHVWGEYHPIKPEGDYNPCTWVGGKVAECVNCDCHISPVIPDAAAKGHKVEEYTDVVVDAAAEKAVLSYICDDCNTKVELPITFADCKADETPATCTADGKIVYTYNYKVGTEDKSIVVYTKVLPATGHTITADSKYTVDLENGVVKVECVDCDDYAVIALSNDINDYTVVNGKCDDNYDYYTTKVTHNGVELVVEFKVEANYGHNGGQLGVGAEWVVIEINGTDYDAYWCNDCKHWIAVRIHVEA